MGRAWDVLRSQPDQMCIPNVYPPVAGSGTVSLICRFFNLRQVFLLYFSYVLIIIIILFRLIAAITDRWLLHAVYITKCQCRIVDACMPEMHVCTSVGSF